MPSPTNGFTHTFMKTLEPMFKSGPFWDKEFEVSLDPCIPKIKIKITHDRHRQEYKALSEYSLFLLESETLLILNKAYISLLRMHNNTGLLEKSFNGTFSSLKDLGSQFGSLMSSSANSYLSYKMINGLQTGCFSCLRPQSLSI